MAACVWNVSSFTTKNSLIRPPKLFAIVRTTSYSQPYIASNRIANQCSTGILKLVPKNQGIKIGLFTQYLHFQRKP